jgi:hypothetical protein
MSSTAAALAGGADVAAAVADEDGWTEADADGAPEADVVAAGDVGPGEHAAMTRASTTRTATGRDLTAGTPRGRVTP